MINNNSNLNDIELLQNREGFEKIFLHYYNPLKAYALTIVYEVETAEDIVQETFYNLWKRRQKLPANLSLSSYLYKAIYNSCLNNIKHQKANLNFLKHKSSEQEIQELFFSAGTTHLYNLDINKFQEFINTTINSLPEQTKRVFLLSRKFNMKNREIAEFLEVSVKAVEKHIGKALKELRIKIKNEYPHHF